MSLAETARLPRRIPPLNGEPEPREAAAQMAHEAVSGAVALWGNAQIEKLAEEAAELSAAAIRYHMNPSRETFDHLAEEAGDVLLTLESFYAMFPDEAEPAVAAMREAKRYRLGCRVAQAFADRERLERAR